jgi:hypothetical protein
MVMMMGPRITLGSVGSGVVVSLNRFRITSTHFQSSLPRFHPRADCFLLRRHHNSALSCHENIYLDSRTPQGWQLASSEFTDGNQYSRFPSFIGRYPSRCFGFDRTGKFSNQCSCGTRHKNKELNRTSCSAELQDVHFLEICAFICGTIVAEAHGATCNCAAHAVVF